MAAAFLLVTVQDLRFGLDLKLAQLLFEPRYCARQLAQVEVYRSELLLEPRARDADLARGIEHVIQKLGIHTRHLRTITGRDGLAPRRHELRRQQDIFRSNARGGWRLRGRWRRG